MAEETKVDQIDRKHPGEPLTVEGRERVARVREMVGPLVLHESNWLKENEITGWGEVVDAEWLLVGAAADMVEMAKSNAQDYLAADLYTAVAFGLVIQSDKPRKVGDILYEFGGGSDRDMDLLDVTADTEGGSRANTPIPMLRREFVRTLTERRKFDSVERLVHKRQFQEDENQRLTASVPVYKWLKSMVNMGVDLGGLYREVFADEEGSEKLQRVDGFLERVKQLKDEEDVETFARLRMGLGDEARVIEEEVF